MAKVRSLESVPFSRYLCLSNVLRICNIRAIPTYRVGISVVKNLMIEKYDIITSPYSYSTTKFNCNRVDES